MSSTSTQGDELLSLSGVSLVYRALPALRSIDWVYRRGQKWACLGPNGAGKTSLARVLCAQETHFSGELHAANSLTEQGVAFVCFEQAQALCARDTKLDDSEFRPDAADPGTTVASAILGNEAPSAAFNDWCQRLRMEHILDRGLRFISTGEMRKALLVKALLSEPALLILDSPLDGLDIESQRQMVAIIDELLASSVNILLLCRALEDVPAGVTHVLALDSGEVLAAGERDRVLTDPGVVALMDPPLPALAPLPEPRATTLRAAGRGPAHRNARRERELWGVACAARCELGF